MATVVCTASNVVQTLVTVPLHQRLIVDDIVVDNGSAADVLVQVEDDFTQDISNGNPAPVARTAFPFQGTIPAGITQDHMLETIPEGQDVICLGTLGIICDGIQALCVITVLYHLED